MIRATTLIHTDSETAAGFEFLIKARKMLVNQQLTMTLRRMSDIEFSGGGLDQGDLDGAIELATTVVVEQTDTGKMIFRGPATTVRVEALLARAPPATTSRGRNVRSTD